jgi:hypothetical protein
MTGKVIHFEIPIEDTEGNRVGLFQTDPTAPMPEGAMPD